MRQNPGSHCIQFHDSAYLPVVTQETVQGAAEAGQTFLISLYGTAESFGLTYLLCEVIQRK
jgi:hypothetical protein